MRRLRVRISSERSIAWKSSRRCHCELVGDPRLRVVHMQARAMKPGWREMNSA